MLQWYMYLAKQNVDGRSQSKRFNAWAKPCLKTSQDIGSVKTYGPKILKKKKKSAKDHLMVLDYIGSPLLI